MKKFICILYKYWGDIAWVALWPLLISFQRDIVELFSQGRHSLFFHPSEIFPYINLQLFIFLVCCFGVFSLYSICRVTVLRKRSFRDFFYLILNGYVLFSFFRFSTTMYYAMNFVVMMLIAYAIVIIAAILRVSFWMHKRRQAKRKPREEDDHDGNEE
ncbi:MAG: hypothetical protein FWD06_08025 [Oscillospiraceae bacterium]|nr:hypothetical protein [Oscillospiraceae bacterium]